jgi:hypothetical protein
MRRNGVWSSKSPLLWRHPIIENPACILYCAIMPCDAHCLTINDTEREKGKEGPNGVLPQNHDTEKMES